MSDAGQHRRIRAMAGGCVGVAGLLGLLLAVPQWCGCTVTPENYETLSFFFDGVPDPTLPASTASLPANDPRRIASYSLHPPYAKEECDTCHRARNRPTRNNGRLCLECHESITTEHPRMHGPVVAMACLWCHNPHESVHKHLLRDTDAKVCGQCHTPDLLSPERVPEHAQPEASCLGCHSGHGGDAPYMLRAPDPNPAPPPPAGVPPNE